MEECPWARRDIHLRMLSHPSDSTEKSKEMNKDQSSTGRLTTALLAQLLIALPEHISIQSIYQSIDNFLLYFIPIFLAREVR